PDTPFGSATEVATEKIDESRSLIHFDLSNFTDFPYLHQPVDVDQSTLKIYVTEVRGHTDESEPEIDLYRITSAWNETGTTWNTRPSISYLYQRNFTSTGWTDIDVTTSTSNFVSETWTNLGWEFVDPSNLFGFKWNTKESSNVPQLIVSSGCDPVNITIDTGDDGTIDYTNTTVYSNSETIDINVTAVQNYLDSCTPDAEDLCNVPFKIHSDAIGQIIVSDLVILYQGDLYVDNVYANVYYGNGSQLVGIEPNMTLMSDTYIDEWEAWDANLDMG
ncbi:unnamed protein product, partial [marine sediment metagenome]